LEKKRAVYQLVGQFDLNGSASAPVEDVAVEIKRAGASPLPDLELLALDFDP
jgi:hypothetical protein